MRRVMVVPSGTEIGLEIAASLRFSKHWDLIGLNSAEDHSEVAYPKNILGCPLVSDPDFVRFVHAVAESEDVDVIIPSHDDAVFSLAGTSRGKARVLGPSPDLAAVLRYKSRTLKALEGIVPCPRMYERAHASLPVFAKPDRGQGSRGARLIRTQDELERVDETCLIQENLPGQEVTVDCLSDRAGKLLYAGPRVRQRVSNGIAVRCAPCVGEADFAATAHAIANALGLTGVWFFQMKQDHSGVFKLLEVANRVPGSLSFQRAQGINLLDAALHGLFGAVVAVPTPQTENILYERALQPRLLWDFEPDLIVVDFDDTLVMSGDGMLNFELAGALLGAKHELGSRIVCVSRHAGDLDATLKSLGLAWVFDEVVHLRSGEPKAAHVAPAHRALFIDDSFAERAQVREQTGAVCIGPDIAADLLSGCLRSRRKHTRQR